MGFDFYFFGNPKGFEVYPENNEKLATFKLYLQQNDVSAFLLVERNTSKVTYTYVRNHIKTKDGFSNAIFGMSLVFVEGFFKDIEYIWNLFDQIYSKIETNAQIINKNSTSNTYYLIESFNNAEEQFDIFIKIANREILKYYKDEVISLDTNFFKSEIQTEKKINLISGNDVFINLLLKYSKIYISPEYKKNEILSLESIKIIEQNIEHIKDNISLYSIRYLKGDDVINSIENDIDTAQNLSSKLNSHIETQPDLKVYINKITNILLSLHELQQLIYAKNTKIIPDSDFNEINANEEVSLEELVPVSPFETEKYHEPPKKRILKPQNQEPKYLPWQTNYPYIKKIVLVLLLIIIVIGGFAYYYYYPKNKQKEDIIIVEDHQDTNENYKVATQDNINKGNLALAENKFEEAIKFFEDANQEEMVKNTKEKAKEYWSIKITETKDLNQQLEYLQKVKSFGGYFSTDDDIANLKKRIKENNDKEETAQKKVSDSKVKTKSANNQTNNSTATKPISDVYNSCNDLKIILNPNKQVYKVGDTFTATAKNSDGSICKDGEWTFETGIWANKTQNPTTFEIKSYSENGFVRLVYKVGSNWSSMHLKINP